MISTDQVKKNIFILQSHFQHKWIHAGVYINVQQLFYFPVCLEFNRQNLFMIMGSSTVTTTVPSIPADPLIKFWMFLRLFLSSKRPGQIVSYLKCTPLLDDFLTLK